MKVVAKKEFESELFLEYSSTPNRTSLGMAKNTMTFYINDDGSRGAIEWEYDIVSNNDTEDDGGAEDIGLWFDEGTKELRDYDGVFELPKQAIELLEENGYNADYAK